MSARLPDTMRWPIAFDARHKAESSLLQAFLVWLDEYFRHTPEERMRDKHIAYWH